MQGVSESQRFIEKLEDTIEYCSE